jgi:uncharacterized membrane protein YgcG
MNNLYEALEICLQELEQGADIETVLSPYPDLADELRPILETSANARKMAISAPSAQVVQRNRAKVLQHAAQLREAKANSSRRIWLASVRRLAVTLAVVAVLFASGTGLVRAASTTLPGDNLYPVKRTWEDVLLAFTFNPQQRDALEVEHENERLHELQEVFAEGRSAKVDFAGSVTSQLGNTWIVSNVQVIVSPQTEIRGGAIPVGSAVRVKGQAQDNKIVSAERIELLPAGAKLPDIGDEHEIEPEKNEGPTQENENNSGKGSGEETPTVEETRTAEPKNESFNGTVNSMDNHVWEVNGIRMDVSSAEIKGTPSVGASVNVEGYYDANGVFVATKIEFENSGSGNHNSSSSNDTNNNTNSSGSNENSVSNSNDSHEDSSHNSNDSSGGGGSGSNSGSGGSGGGGGDD